MSELHTKDDFIKLFHQIARSKHRYEIFSDFVMMSAISIHNRIHKDQGLEDEYMNLIGKYEKKDQLRFPQLLSVFINLLDRKPTDVLGDLYMRLEISNKNNAQFLTPPDISTLCSQMVQPDFNSLLKKQKFITLSDPACGTGGMILEYVNNLLQSNHNPAATLFVECIDIDRVMALGCFLQLALWNVPARVYWGDTLRMDMKACYCTPAYILYGWHDRLAVYLLIRDSNYCSSHKTRL